MTTGSRVPGSISGRQVEGPRELDAVLALVGDQFLPDSREQRRRVRERRQGLPALLLQVVEKIVRRIGLRSRAAEGLPCGRRPGTRRTPRTRGPGIGKAVLSSASRGPADRGRDGRPSGRRPPRQDRSDPCPRGRPVPRSSGWSGRGTPGRCTGPGRSSRRSSREARRGGRGSRARSSASAFSNRTPTPAPAPGVASGARSWARSLNRKTSTGGSRERGGEGHHAVAEGGFLLRVAAVEGFDPYERGRLQVQPFHIAGPGRDAVHRNGVRRRKIGRGMRSERPRRSQTS